MKTSAITTLLDLIPLLAGTQEGEVALSQFAVSPDLIAAWRDRAIFDVAVWPSGMPRWLPHLATNFRRALAESRSRVVWTAPEHPLPAMIVFYGIRDAAVVGFLSEGVEITVLPIHQAVTLIADRLTAADQAAHDWDLGRWVGSDLDVRLRSHAGQVSIQARDPEQAGALSRSVDFDELITQLAVGHP